MKLKLLFFIFLSLSVLLQMTYADQQKLNADGVSAKIQAYPAFTDTEFPFAYLSYNQNNIPQPAINKEVISFGLKHGIPVSFGISNNANEGFPIILDCTYMFDPDTLPATQTLMLTIKVSVPLSVCEIRLAKNPAVSP